MVIAVNVQNVPRAKVMLLKPSVQVGHRDAPLLCNVSSIAHPGRKHNKYESLIRNDFLRYHSLLPMISNSNITNNGGLLTFGHGLHILINRSIGLIFQKLDIPEGVPMRSTYRLVGHAVKLNRPICRCARKGVPVQEI